MAKLVILKFDGGDFQKGFNGTLQIGNEGKHLANIISGKLLLPPNPTMPENYQRWQSDFLELDKCLRGRRGSTGVFDPNQILEQCRQSARDLINNFKDWLNSQDSALQNLREKLCQQLGNPKEPIRVIIQTDDAVLKKLPWHEMDLFANTYTQAEVALCPSEYKESGVVQTTEKSALRILAILGNSEGINVDSDRESLEKLRLNGAAPTFLVEPKRTEVSDSLWEQTWDILFFAGHSSSQNDKGRIFINTTESLTIEELKFGLQKTINYGLQLAILNSCDGLKLAEDLADLNIPQVILMREPVPDKVAQEFLQFFLKAFTGGESLYVAVRHARERLHENGLDNEFPGASWLPIIYQNPTVIPPSWDQLKPPELKISHDEVSQSGNRYRSLDPSKPITPRRLSREQEIGIGDNGNSEGIMSNVQFLLTHFLPGLIAGIGGLSLMVVLLIYGDIIQAEILKLLMPTQATIVIFSIIGLTFFIAIIGIYAWLATKKDIQFKYVVVFMILILTMFAFISAGVYFYIPTISSDDEIVTPSPNPYWYSKAIEALEESGNSSNKGNALAYINKGLKKVPENDPQQIVILLALKIKVLLLIGGSDNQTEASNVAKRNYGYSFALDGWIDCLKKENLFSYTSTTETELEAKCPSPIYNDLFMRRNNAFGTKLTGGIKELLENGVMIKGTNIRFDDFMAQKTEGILLPQSNNALAVSYGIAVIPDYQERDKRATHYLEIALRTADIAPLRHPEIKALPVNFVFVVDTSSSMEGKKLDTVKTAIKELFDNLKADDVLGVITFSSQVKTVLKATPVKKIVRDEFAKIIISITASSGTDINLGLKYGIDEISRHSGSHKVNQIFLFSDGNPTSGEANWIHIRQNIDAKIRESQDGIRLSTFGFGTDASRKELDKLAGISGGQNTFVIEPEDVKHNLQQELETRTHLAAINIQMQIGIDPDISILHLYGHDLITDPIRRAAVLKDIGKTKNKIEKDYDVKPLPDIMMRKKGIRISVPNLALGETYWVVFEIAMPKQRSQSAFGNATIRYLDTFARQNENYLFHLSPKSQIASQWVTQHALGLWTSEVVFYALDDLYDNDLDTAEKRISNHISVIEAAINNISSEQLRDDVIILKKFLSLAQNLGKMENLSDNPQQIKTLFIRGLNEFGRSRNGSIKVKYDTANK